mmetsp:Transcript_5086/g.9976  ORF Transcript_5086/g.9976 Transcript_5086/m.9976 type:complete len:126 (-) Transcript_5086:196-573(-)|eukprot:CAMPEP_0201616242 /NCGR_PEP_ID=MMETSP0492-20130828/33394_1 /ASSEMBLY_ACC=CAM_ASM_000837 /TAXON_ID=420259 /ORGANISM="Thalassiosira gravida, Strain GMp14c1" /LENGTH=125 /DNA_ID=CAMNT_0048084129 /DNA_START=140 /DNA_END=517 /DNA_ORIENTATION=+
MVSTTRRRRYGRSKLGRNDDDCRILMEDVNGVVAGVGGGSKDTSSNDDDVYGENASTIDFCTRNNERSPSPSSSFASMIDPPPIPKFEGNSEPTEHNIRAGISIFKPNRIPESNKSMDDSHADGL